MKDDRCDTCGTLIADEDAFTMEGDDNTLVPIANVECPMCRLCRECAKKLQKFGEECDVLNG